MLQWFFGLSPLYRILILAIIVSLLLFASPFVKVTPRNIAKTFLFLVAAVLIYFLWSGEDPRSALKRISQPPSEENPLPSVPKYYEDPEKRWGENR